MPHRLSELIKSLGWFGEFRCDCYYCDRQLHSRNLFVIEMKRAYHLAIGHGKDPDEMPDDEYDAVTDHMTIYDEYMDRSEFVEGAES
jgi:hypothetical protein